MTGKEGKPAQQKHVMKGDVAAKVETLTPQILTKKVCLTCFSVFGYL